MNLQVNDQRVHDKCYRKEGPEQYRQQMHIPHKGAETARADGIGNKAHDPERCKADHPLHNIRYHIRQIIDDCLCLRRGATQGDAAEHTPGKDADIVGTDQSVERIIDHTQNQIV